MQLLGCLRGIAEAYYKEVPSFMAEKMKVAICHSTI